jgi:protein O-mannosyl-transferase
VAIALAAILAYSNSFSGAFVFDDVPAILGPQGPAALGLPDPGATTAGRPLLRSTLALNAWISGTDPWSYHLFNLLLHTAGALMLFAVLRRLLAQPGLPEAVSRNARTLAGTTALLWAVHPLQTAAVTYVIQRAEVLAALGILVTVYASLRARSEGRHQRGWQALAFVACTAGMTAKETAAVAPLLVLLVNLAVPPAGAHRPLRARFGLPLVLTLSWIVLIPLVISNAGRGGTAGFDAGISPWAYLLTQGGAILQYLARVPWPHPLIFDYGTATAGTIAEAALSAVVVGGLVLASVAVFARGRRSLGALGLGFFVVLAPSSSVVPIASQTIAEHRMYLALAFPLLGLVLAFHRLAGARVLTFAAGAAAVALGLATADRNRDYHSALALWRDTVAKRPENARAWINHGLALLEAGDPEAALRQLDGALARDPRLADGHFNRGVVLTRLARPAEAMAAYREAVRLRPSHPEALNNLGSLELASGRAGAAEAHFRDALAQAATYDAARLNLGLALLDLGRPSEAGAEAERLLRSRPSAAAHYLLGNARLAQGRPADARESFQRAVTADPRHAGAHNNLANLLIEDGRFGDAVERYGLALAADPSLVPARRNLARVLVHLGRPAEARAHYEELLRLRPGDASLRDEYQRLPRR